MTLDQRIARLVASVPEPCPDCQGEGGYWDDQTGQPDEPYGGRMVTCSTCHGSGKEEEQDDA